MPGKSNLPMHPYMEELMRVLGCEDLRQMSRRTDIKYTTLRNWAFDEGFQVCQVRHARRLAKAVGCSLDELVAGFDKKSVA